MARKATAKRQGAVAARRRAREERWRKHLKAWDGGLSQPQCRLIRIQVDAKQDEHWLRGTLIDHWLALVEANYPALKPAVAKIRRNKV